MPLSLVCETDLPAILALASAKSAAVLVIDSIQTAQSGAAGAGAGAVTQLRECTAELVRYAKATGCAVVIVGHVTKEGAIAGPRLLEHLVDTVLYFQSEAGSRYRIVRATKNRFGAVNELGFFAMTRHGPEGSEESGGDLPGARARACRRQHRHGDARGRPAAADRAAGAGGPHALRGAAAHRPGTGRQPPGDAARRGQPPRGRLAAGARRVRQRRGRHRDRRDRLGHAGADRARLEPRRPRGAGIAGGLRGDRPHRGGAPGGLRRRAAARGACAGVQGGNRAARECSAPRAGGAAVVPVGRISEALEAALGSRQGNSPKAAWPPAVHARAPCAPRCPRSAAPRTRSPRRAPSCRRWGWSPGARAAGR